MRLVVVLAICAVVGGCGLAARKEREEAMAAAKAAMDDGFARCTAEYQTAGAKNQIAKTKCDFVAASNIRPYVPYPDLFDQEWATRAVIAEKVQAGKLTPAEANQEATTMHASITAEEQRRSLTGRAVSAQESAAAAAWRASAPVSCTRIGNTTSCY